MFEPFWTPPISSSSGNTTGRAWLSGGGGFDIPSISTKKGLTLLECSVHIKEHRNLNTEVYREPTQTDRLDFHKLRVIRARLEQQEVLKGLTKKNHIKTALRTCEYTIGTMVKVEKKRAFRTGLQEDNIYSICVRTFKLQTDSKYSRK